MDQLKICQIVAELNKLASVTLPNQPANEAPLQLRRFQVLQPVADIINDPDNLFFLATGVNGAVSLTIQHRSSTIEVVVPIESEVCRQSGLQRTHQYERQSALLAGVILPTES